MHFLVNGDSRCNDIDAHFHMKHFLKMFLMRKWQQFPLSFENNYVKGLVSTGFKKFKCSVNKVGQVLVLYLL